MNFKRVAVFRITDIPLIGVWISILTVALTSQAVVGDMYVITSIHNMEALAQQEQRLTNSLINYISTQQEKLRLLKLKMEDLSTIRPADYPVEDLIGDPITAYALIRRMTREWPLTLNFLMHNVGVGEGNHHELTKLPKEEDLASAVRGLIRLQEVYQLDTKRLSQGTTGHNHLNALDCFEIGKFLFKEHKPKLSELWFKEALEKLTKLDKTVEEDKVLPHLFLATLNSECDNKTNSAGASKVLHSFSLQYPNHMLDSESAPHFRQALSEPCKSPEKLGNWMEQEVERNKTTIFSDTCRGVGLKNSPKLKCFYIHYNNPRLLIAPFKMEEQNLDPPVLMFHGVVSDQEIGQMKKVFNKVRGRCMTFNQTKPGMNEYRTCDVGWVRDNVTAASARLTRRVGDMTNLNMRFSEDNQVASYGLSGAYFLHLDTHANTSFPFSPIGSRIATLMFYLSDVEAGGYTVFPRLHLAIKPVKGSAAFWFNLDHRSDLLETTLHGGCPILKGSKWVLNKWIHEAGQTGDMFCPVDEKFPRPRYYMNGIVK